VNAKISKISAVFLGAAAVSIQTEMMREIMALYGFNELIIAVILFVWLLWGAAGSLTYSGKNVPTQFALLGVSALLMPALVKVCAAVLHPTFGLVVPVQIVLITALAGSLPAFFAGRVFSSLTNFAPSGILYAYEGIGSFAGGLLTLGFMFLPQNAPAILIAMLLAVPVYLFKPALLKKYLAAAIVLTFVLNLAAPHIDAKIWRGFDHREINSPHGKIVILSQGGENYLYQSGKLLASEGDTLGAEQIIHPVMWAQDTGKSVLLVGGLFAGAGKDILAHSPSSVDFPYTDARLYSVALADFPHIRRIWGDKRFHPIRGDVRSFLRRTDKKYDVVFILPGVPLSGGDNRFWTQEFYQQVSSHLAEDGVVAVGIPVGANYLSPYQAELCAGILATFSAVFPNPEIYYLDGAVLIYHDRRFAGKNTELAERLLELLKSQKLRPVRAATVQPGYLPILFQPQRRTTLWREIAGAKFVRINHDWNPLIYIWGVLEQIYLAGVRLPADIFRHGEHRTLLIFLAVALALAILSLRKSLRPVGLVLVGGMWGILAQTLFMLVFQANFGTLYYLIGAGTGIFLLGTTFGSFCGTRFRRPSQAGIVISVAIIFMTTFLGYRGTFVPLWGFLGIFFLSGSVSGFAFGLASQGEIPGGKLYAADLLGAAVGTAISLYVLPASSPLAVVAYLGALMIMSLVCSSAG